MNLHSSPSAMDAHRTETAGRQPLTQQRRDILKELGKVSRELAQIYEAALRLLDDETMPARGRLLAHGARELINRLPDHLDVPIAANRVQYESALDAVVALWDDDRHRQKAPRNLVDGVGQESTITASAEITISDKLDGLIGGLVKDHRLSRIRREERLMGVLQPREQSRISLPTSQLKPFVRQWKDLSRWFAGHAHVPNPDKEPLDFSECEGQFRTLEDMLYSRLCPFYGAVEVLDDILEEANRRRG
jgi:hypothetical protein